MTEKTDEIILSASEIIHCTGHENVLALHKSTFEVTMEEHLTKSGDCIIGINADKGIADLSTEFKNILAREGSVLITVLETGGKKFTVHSSGSPALTFENKTDFVWRKSGFVCGRTIGIISDASARMIPREIIAELQNGKEMTVTMTALFNPKAQLPSVPPLQEFFHSL